jgi:ketosteroid isomerase-like protein
VKRLAAALCALALACAAAAQEPDHETHEALRNVLKEVVTAINAGQYDRIQPYLAENIAATSITQEVMKSRADVSNYFKEWFGPTGYMKTMRMQLDADGLTEFSPDKSWGLVRGNALEHYEAKDGDVFDFKTRWTALMERGQDGQWRLRAIHFGTNNLDNPVLWKVRNTLVRDGVIAAVVSLVAGVAIGWFLARRRARPVAA